MVSSDILGSSVSVGTSSKRRPIAIVLMGQPCSGKSTLANKLRESMQGVAYVSSDIWLETVAYTNDMTYDEAFKQYVKEADKYRRECLQEAVSERMDVIWDQTNLNLKYQFPKEYYKIAVVMPPVSWERTEQVNAIRKGKTISKEVWHKFAAAYATLAIPRGSFDEIICAPFFELNTSTTTTTTKVG